MKKMRPPQKKKKNYFHQTFVKNCSNQREFSYNVKINFSTQCIRTTISLQACFASRRFGCLLLIAAYCLDAKLTSKQQYSVIGFDRFSNASGRKFYFGLRINRGDSFSREKGSGVDGGRERKR